MQPKIIPEELEKKNKKQKDAKACRREIIKIRVEINGIETEKKNKQQNRSMKPGSDSLKKIINFMNNKPDISKRNEKNSNKYNYE